MSNAKAAVQSILQRLPDNTTLAEIEYEIYVCRKVEQGLADSESGRVLTMDEMQVRFAQWLDESDGQP